jgi:hypothetical protein
MTTIRKNISLTDPAYFCNKSFTISFNMNTKSWISFHSYLPNFYVGENNFFYSGLNGCCDDFEFIVGIPADESNCYLRGATAFYISGDDPNCDLTAASIRVLSNCELTEATAYVSDACDLTGATAIILVPPQGEIITTTTTSTTEEPTTTTSTTTEELTTTTTTTVL